MILSNQIRCKKCGDEPFSAHRHDFKWCKCGAVAVDGGMDYLKRVGDLTALEEMYIDMDKTVVQELKDQLQWCEDTGRDDLGVICAIMRTLRDNGYSVQETPTQMEE